MKRFLLLLLSIILLSSFVLAKDVAYVVKNPSLPDNNFINVLGELNLSYDLIDDSAISSTNFANYRMILLGNEKINNVPVNNYKSLFANPDYYTGWSAYKGSVASSQALKANNIAGNSITEGLEGIFQVYTQAKDNSGLSLAMYYLYGRKYNVEKITTTIDSLSKYVVATKQTPRRVFFGITKSAYWTSVSRELFANAVIWVLIGDDKDGDGFYTDDDCDDNNAEINPDMEEIPYDGLDNNCDGLDLADLDNDGYCLAGYYIQNKAIQCNLDGIIGGDCDDEDLGIHPNAYDPINDVDENCVNDVPIYQGYIPDEVWNEDTESENVYDLSDYFFDRDGDDLEYDVEGNVHVDVLIEGSLVSLVPEENWHGSEHVKFIADDGSLEVKSDYVVFVVLNVNDAPVLDEIENIKTVEGQLVKIIPGAFDIDGDSLRFSYSQPFNSRGEWQTRVGDAGIRRINVTVDDYNFGFDSQEVEVEVLPKLIINEFVSNPDDEEEWIEIYNPHNYSISLDSFTLEDGTGNIDELAGEINAYGFYVFYPNFVLNNDGDIIILKNNEIEADKVAYGNWNDGNISDNVLLPALGKSAARNPDGKDTDNDLQDFSILDIPTKGITNLADLTPPVVNLLSPENDAFFNVNYVNFNFTAYDNKASRLNCSFYSDVNGTFEKLAEKTINNNTISSFYASEIDDGDYTWQIRCYDGYNFGLSEIRSFIVDEPDVPVVQDISDISVNENESVRIEVNATDMDDDELEYSINDTRFVQDETDKNVFTWLTDFDDAGIYNFKISVSDGVFNITKNVKVTVLNKNRQPVLEDIGEQTINEDERKETIINASDPDNDALIFSVTEENINEVNCEINGGNLILIPALNWNGNTSCRVQVSDNYLGDSKIFDIVVLPVNDAPVLQQITNIVVNEGEEVEIIADAVDVENDELDYSINDTIRFSQENNIFTWLTNYSDAGIYYVLVEVSDDKGGHDSQEVRIEVNDVNEPPYLLPIPDFEIEEDSGFYLNGNLSAYDNDGYIVEFSVINENINEVDCDVTDGILGVTPAENWFGIGENAASCTIQAKDDDNAVDSKTFRINVTNVNDAPIIDSYSPRFIPKIPENGRQEFSVVWQDIDNTEAEVNVKWYVDDVFAGIGDNFVFVGDGTAKMYNIKVMVSDLNESAEHLWNLITSNIPLTEKYNGETTNFTGMTEQDLQSVNLILEKLGFGKIEFLEAVDLRDAVDLDKYTEIQKGLAGIDTNIFPDLKNKKARVTFYGLSFNKTPTIYYSSEFNLEASGIICPNSICSNINYSAETGILTFDVTSFSTFIVGETRTCSQQSGFICSGKEICKGSLLEARDSNACCSQLCIPKFSEIDLCENISDEVRVEIKEPDENDEFKVGENIKVEAKIENKGEEDLDFDVYLSLYDIEEDEEVENKEEELEIGENDKEEIEFEIEVPSSIEEDNRYAVYLKAEDEDGNYCNQDYVHVKIEREKHNIVINELSLPENVTCGEVVEAEIKMENIGEKDEDVRIEVEDKDLNLSFVSEEFELENYDGNSKVRKNFLIGIPKDVESKVYPIKIKLTYSGETETSWNMNVECKNETIAYESVEANIINILSQKEKEGKFTSVMRNDKNNIIILDIMLVIGILVVGISIISKFLIKRKKKIVPYKIPSNLAYHKAYKS